jgi:DNA-binding MarR family transcriptional regulator
MFDNILHQPIRSKLIATLLQNEELPFKALREKLNLTDGNLSSHLKKLEEVQYIQIDKFFENKRPKTVVKITTQGKDAFKAYIKQLKQFIQEN